MKKAFQKTAIVFVISVTIFFVYSAINTINEYDKMFDLVHGK